MKTTFESGFWQAGNCCPFGESFNLSLYGKVAGYTGIIVLLFLSSPHTIFRTVIFVILFALKSMFGTGPLAHIFTEQEIVIPPFTNLDTAPAVMFVVGTVGIHAALPHIYPHFINAFSVLPVCSVSHSSHFAFQTSATARCAVTQISVPYNSFGFTLASTQKTPLELGTGSPLFHFFQNRPSAKDLTRQIKKFTLGISHCKNLLNRFEFGEAWGSVSANSQAVSIF